MVIFERLAGLLLPAAGGGRVVEADERWRLGLEAEGLDDDVIVWGRPPLPMGRGFGASRKFAGERRRALVRLRRRPPRGLRVVDSVWWMPPDIGRGRLKQPLKNALAAGAALTLSSGERFERVLDAAWADAGLGDRPEEVRPSSGGSARVDVDDERVIFRAGPAGSPVDPRAAAEILSALESAGVERVPRALRAGEIASAGWALESRLDGTRPVRLGDELVGDVLTLLAGLSRSEGPPRAFEDDLDAIGRHLPDARKALEELVEPHRVSIERMPAVVRHGDLWVGNLLEVEGRLSGVVDWDAAHSEGVPGTDLVHLLGGEGSLGERFARRPWRDEAFRRATSTYWEAVGVDPEITTLDAVGVAWWVGQVAANLDRLPHLAGDSAWMDANVREVLEL